MRIAFKDIFATFKLHDQGNIDLPIAVNNTVVLPFQEDFLETCENKTLTNFFEYTVHYIVMVRLQKQALVRLILCDTLYKLGSLHKS